MLQYTRAADPTEREARIERVRQAEERGELEEAALHMLQASNNTISKDNTPANATPERLSASQRLGPAPQSHSTDRRKSSADLSTDNRERLPATLRLGPPPLELGQLSNERSEIQTVTTTERVPAPLRLGPLNLENAETRVVPEPEPTKRKPGRPPGPRKNTGENPSSKTRVIASKRKVTQKPSPIRRKITADSEGTTTIKKKTGRPKTGGTSRAAPRILDIVAYFWPLFASTSAFLAIAITLGGVQQLSDEATGEGIMDYVAGRPDDSHKYN
ncbi:hypothetical protein Bca52824_087808 [Brassica carinata]|uniref:Uncharacterized protein n=1 Tax=Brassica carinata TaxID=52824 RepID=A0A8X7PBH9_BRACI|nr:hypothetical protein Bca52824_087808 [Brassica carinata]